MGRFEDILTELDKGDYDQFTDVSLLTFEIMREFNYSHTSSRYVAMAFLHYKKRKTDE